MGFLHVGQSGLELPTSGDLPASASQSAGITGLSHRAWPSILFLYQLTIFIPSAMVTISSHLPIFSNTCHMYKWDDVEVKSFCTANEITNKQGEKAIYRMEKNLQIMYVIRG